MSTEENHFIDKIYYEFEQKLYKVFGFGIDELKKVLDRPETPERPGHDLELELKEAYETGGAPQLRWQMNNIIVCLEYVFMMDRMDREPTYDEWVDHIMSLNIGMTKDDLVPFEN